MRRIMKKSLWKFLLVSPVLSFHFATSLLINDTAVAQTQTQEETLEQVTSVSQFSLILLLGQNFSH